MMTVQEAAFELLQDFNGLCETANFMPIGAYIATQVPGTPATECEYRVTFHDHPSLELQIETKQGYDASNNPTINRKFYLTETFDPTGVEFTDECGSLSGAFHAICRILVRNAINDYFERKTEKMMNDHADNVSIEGYRKVLC